MLDVHTTDTEIPRVLWGRTRIFAPDPTSKRAALNACPQGNSAPKYLPRIQGGETQRGFGSRGLEPATDSVSGPGGLEPTVDSVLDPGDSEAGMDLGLDQGVKAKCGFGVGSME